MENLDKPKTIFIGLSVALLPLLYATFISFTLRSIGGSCVNTAGLTAKVQKVPVLVPYYVTAVGILFISTALVMYALSIQHLS